TRSQNTPSTTVAAADLLSRSISPLSQRVSYTVKILSFTAGLDRVKNMSFIVKNAIVDRFTLGRRNEPLFDPSASRSVYSWEERWASARSSAWEERFSIGFTLGTRDGPQLDRYNLGQLGRFNGSTVGLLGRNPEDIFSSRRKTSGASFRKKQKLISLLRFWMVQKIISFLSAPISTMRDFPPTKFMSLVLVVIALEVHLCRSLSLSFSPHVSIDVI
ncbi:hypothetical protein EUTSA_v10003360mg, partial [Eutrema salsugineum]